jgi:predicted nucleotidyltransferase
MTMGNRDIKEVRYDASHWALLRRLRGTALQIMKALAARNMNSAVYGSVARGDVNDKSDVDVIVPYQVSSTTIELALKLGGFKLFTRKIAQATPSHTPKAHIYLDPLEQVCVTFPLASFRSLEQEFYRFGGFLRAADLMEETRVPGCDKKLMLIQPTQRGHTASPIIGREGEVAAIVGVGVRIVEERIRVLTRREKVGRTGIVFSRELEEDAVFEEVLKRVADANPIVRRRLRKR